MQEDNAKGNGSRLWISSRGYRTSKLSKLWFFGCELMPRPTKKEKTCPKCGHSGGLVIGVYHRYGTKFVRVGWYCTNCETDY